MQHLGSKVAVCALCNPLCWLEVIVQHQSLQAVPLITSLSPTLLIYCPALALAAMWVLHTTRTAGGVQEGRLEALAEGTTVVMEVMPQVRSPYLSYFPWVVMKRPCPVSCLLSTCPCGLCVTML